MVSVQTIDKAIEAAPSAHFDRGETPKIPKLTVVHSQNTG
jgi:hypothetical protein